MGYDAYKPLDIAPRDCIRVGKKTTAAGVEQVQLGNCTYDYTSLTADGDRWFFYYIATGAETKLTLTYRKEPDAGIADMYINGTLDTAGTDFYAAAAASALITITLTVKPKPGLNTIEFRVNGKNGASTAYRLEFYVMRLHQ